MTLIEVALSEWGEAERIGPTFNPRIAEYLATCGLGPNDEQPWCAAFITWCAARCGIMPPPLPAVARSWLTVGQPVTNPRVGDIVVLKRGESWQGHVGLFIRFTESCRSAFVLAGNQGDRVSIEPFGIETVIAFRQLGGNA